MRGADISMERAGSKLFSRVGVNGGVEGWK